MKVGLNEKTEPLKDVMKKKIYKIITNSIFPSKQLRTENEYVVYNCCFYKVLRINKNWSFTPVHSVYVICRVEVIK